MQVIELQGRFATAKIFTDVVDQDSIAQVMGLLNQPYAADAHVRMMPDIHAGVGCTIGTTMRIQDKICPNLVGVDIGCGMETVQLREKRIELQKLDVAVRENIPSGFAVRGKPHRYNDDIDLSQLHCFRQVDESRAVLSIGTLGGGNHFIEVDRDEEGNLYLVVHSGSRHLGVEVAKAYQNLAIKHCCVDAREELERMIESLKAQGRQVEIEETRKSFKSSRPYVPRELAWVEGELMAMYLHDMAIAQHFAALNRQAMVDTILKVMKLHPTHRFTTIHNYIDLEHRILRKGAVSARAGERLIIPINMRDGSLICTGRGEEDWNFSAPHGAGRLMSRSAAKESFTVSAFKKEMAGIFTTSVGAGTLDECPMAYKGMADIVDNIGPTVNIERIIRPVYNFKASGD